MRCFPLDLGGAEHLPILVALESACTINPGEVTIFRREEYEALVTRLVETGRRRAELFRNITDEELARRIPDDHYGGGIDSSIWWILVRANLDHEIHHRGAPAVYLRVLKEMDGAPIGALP